jgi:hypothetical protein
MKKTIFIFVLWAALMVAEAAVLMGKIPFPIQLLWTIPVGNLIALMVIGVSFGWSDWWGVDEDHWSLFPLYVFSTVFQGLTILGAAHAGAPEELPLTGEGLATWMVMVCAVSSIAMLFFGIVWYVASYACVCKARRSALLFC